MWQIQKYFDDYSDGSGFRKGVLLNADKSLIYGELKPPITWRGSVGGVQVEIVQNDIIPLIEYFIFVDYPEKYNYLKEDIIGYIDECIRKETD